MIRGGITDEALAMLSLLLGFSEELQDIKNSRVLVPILIDLLRFWSAKRKENSITLLLGMCKEGGEVVARRLLANPRSIPSLLSFAALACDGTHCRDCSIGAALNLVNQFDSRECNGIIADAERAVYLVKFYT